MVTKIPLEFFGFQIKAKKIKYNDPGSSKTPLKISCKDFFWVFQSPFNFTKYSFPKIRFAFLWMREKEGWLVG